MELQALAELGYAGCPGRVAVRFHQGVAAAVVCGWRCTLGALGQVVVGATPGVHVADLAEATAHR